MRRENQRALQKATCDHATEMAIPCMAMNHIDILERGHPLQINIKRLQDFLETFISRIVLKLLAKANRTNVVGIVILRTKATGFYMAELGKFLAQELDVDTCTAIDFWRKFISKDSSIHRTNRG